MQFLVFLILLLALVVIFKGAQLLRRNQENTGYKRVAYVISGFWLGVPLLLMFVTKGFSFAEIDEQAWIAWVILAVIPNTLFWSLLWILQGFRRS